MKVRKKLAVTIAPRRPLKTASDRPARDRELRFKSCDSATDMNEGQRTDAMQESPINVESAHAGGLQFRVPPMVQGGKLRVRTLYMGRGVDGSVYFLKNI